jgi:hypothetical protein
MCVCVCCADSSNPLEKPCDDDHEELMKNDPSKVLLPAVQTCTMSATHLPPPT